MIFNEKDRINIIRSMLSGYDFLPEILNQLGADTFSDNDESIVEGSITTYNNQAVTYLKSIGKDSGNI